MPRVLTLNELGVMSRLRRVTVIFACSHCGATYSAIQRPASDFGSFDCWDCKTEIYRWSTKYSYTDWEQITVAVGNAQTR